MHKPELYFHIAYKYCWDITKLAPFLRGTQGLPVSYRQMAGGGGDDGPATIAALAARSSSPRSSRKGVATGSTGSMRKYFGVV